MDEPASLDMLATVVDGFYQALDRERGRATDLHAQLQHLEQGWARIDAAVVATGIRARRRAVDHSGFDHPSQAQQWLRTMSERALETQSWVARVPAVLATLDDPPPAEAVGRSFPLPAPESQKLATLRANVFARTLALESDAMQMATDRLIKLLQALDVRRAQVEQIGDVELQRLLAAGQALITRPGDHAPPLAAWQRQADDAMARSESALQGWSPIGLSRSRGDLEQALTAAATREADLQRLCGRPDVVKARQALPRLLALPSDQAPRLEAWQRTARQADAAAEQAARAWDDRALDNALNILVATVENIERTRVALAIDSLDELLGAAQRLGALDACGLDDVLTWQTEVTATARKAWNARTTWNAAHLQLADGRLRAALDRVDAVRAEVKKESDRLTQAAHVKEDNATFQEQQRERAARRRVFWARVRHLFAKSAQGALITVPVLCGPGILFAYHGFGGYGENLLVSLVLGGASATIYGAARTWRENVAALQASTHAEHVVNALRSDAARLRQQSQSLQELHRALRM